VENTRHSALPGLPGLPHHTQKETLFSLLDPGEKIAAHPDEERCAMFPTAAVSELRIFSHPAEAAVISRVGQKITKGFR